MTKRVKIRRIGNALGAILPKELLEELKIREGDELSIIRTEKGLTLTPYDPEFETIMHSFEHIRRKYRNTLKKLAE